jgi:hypothetical protein
MKKIFFSILMFVSVAARSQDSVSVTITAGARDLEYIGSFVYGDNIYELLFDSLKVKFRVQNPPAGTNPVTVTAMTGDWILVLRKLYFDPVAINAGCTNRISTLLEAVNQPYLNGKITEIKDASNTTPFGAGRVFGRFKLRRQQ